VTHDDKVLLKDGQVPMLATAAGEYPSDTAERILENVLRPDAQQLLGITTETAKHYDQLTVWYHTNGTTDTPLPDGWTWGEIGDDTIPVVIRNQLGSLTY
ncbi:MAG: hypothetical protein AAF125_26110, partial [Chloroflexota bacterium]